MDKFNDLGLFWNIDKDNKRPKAQVLLPRADIPSSDWKPPRDFPNLSGAKLIGLDTETYDPNLKTNGPGWARDDGHIVGISLSTGEQNWYFPIRHTIQPELNMDINQVYKFLSDVLGTNCDKTGANLSYDVGWLDYEGVIVQGRLLDIQYAEALLFDTAKSFSLDTLSKKYIGVGKTSNAMYEWSAKSYGGEPNSRSQGGNIYRCPTTLVGPYAEDDAGYPIKIMKQQQKMLVDSGLWDLFMLECKLTRVLLGMRKRGVPISEDGAHKANVFLTSKINEHRSALKDILGFEINPESPEDLVKAHKSLNIKYATTSKGNPSFSEKALLSNPSIITPHILKARKHKKARDTFVTNAILNKQYKGKIYPTLHPLRTDDNGAVSGRFASSMPNIQQFPSRNVDTAPLVRGIFVPEDGHTGWIKLDYSQIEYRIFAHVSNDENLIQSYQDPTTDYHTIVGEMLNGLLPRKLIKTLNFGSLFGMGYDAILDYLKLSLTSLQAEDILMSLVQDPQFSNSTELFSVLARAVIEKYASQFPAAGESLQRYSQQIMRTGEIRTLLNRRNTFELWEPAGYGSGTPLPLKQARSAYGEIVRAGSHRGLNRVTQGGSADMIKKGMVDAYEEGLFDEDRLGFPHITVHDELDFSFKEDYREDFRTLRNVMQNAIKLKVPVIMDAELGTNWGNVEEMEL